MGLVIYRKYRPKTFTEIIGQEHVVQTLTNAISSGAISHAYLFTGPRGSGKTTIARILAKAVNCEVRNKKYEEVRSEKYEKGKKNLQASDFRLQTSPFEPCNQCSSCQEINEGRAIDLIEIDAASHRGIDEIRELKEGIRFVPTKSKYKVFIIDESHQLTKEAANALLKTLEEPPGHAIFVLATTEIQKMIPTIISRCQRFDFWKLTLPQIIKRLEFISKKEGIKIEKEALELIALAASGSIRDGESLLDQAITFTSGDIKVKDIKDLLGIVEISQVSQFVEFLAKKEVSSALNFLNEIIERGGDLPEFTKFLINYLRQILISKINPELKNSLILAITKEEEKKLINFVGQFSETQLQNILKLLLEAESKMKYSPIPQLPLELAIIEAIGPTNN